MLALAALAVLGFAALDVMLWRPRPLEGQAPSGGPPRTSGVLHVHTTLSDGGGTPDEVIAEAQAAGLGFLGISDHNTLDAKPAEGYHGSLLVVVGTEISTTAGHVLGFGIPEPAFRFSGDGLDALEDVRDLGGVAFAAHAENARADFRFTGWDLPGPWGLELMNGDSQWRSAGWLRLLRAAALYRLNRPYALLGSLSPPTDTLARWDALLARRDVAGIVGADAHSRVPIRKQWSLRFPGYAALFGLARNHVLLEAAPTGEAQADERALLRALAQGRGYVALDALAPADGFFFEAESEGRRHQMGETVAPGPALTLRSGGELPRSTRLTLLRDGKPLAEAEGRFEVPAPRPGVYRVEARVPGWSVPFILSNPIYVFGADEAAARAARAAWPAEATPPPAVETLADFEGSSPFAAEFDPSSSVGREILDRSEHASGASAARLAFRLGAPGPGRPSTWCALVDRQARDLSGRRGLLLSIKADGVYRIWVQVRDLNPASADEGTEWWFASIRTSPQWRRVAVPFSRLRSINKASDGRLDLDRVRGIAFILDAGAIKPGTAGTIFLDDVGVY